MMSDLFKRYLREKEGLQLYEEENWFITYSVLNDFRGLKEFYISHIYFEPEIRGGKHKLPVWDKVLEIANSYEADYISGDVDCTLNDPEKSLKFLFREGFKIDKLDGQIIYLFKPLKEGI